jgi:hypothetical protein
MDNRARHFILRSTFFRRSFLMSSSLSQSKKSAAKRLCYAFLPSPTTQTQARAALSGEIKSVNSSSEKPPPHIAPLVLPLSIDRSPLAFAVNNELHFAALLIRISRVCLRAATVAFSFQIRILKRDPLYFATAALRTWVRKKPPLVRSMTCW